MPAVLRHDGIGHTTGKTHGKVQDSFRLNRLVAEQSIRATTLRRRSIVRSEKSDQDCTVCALRNQSLADLSGELQVRPTEDAETLAQTRRTI